MPTGSRAFTRGVGCDAFEWPQPGDARDVNRPSFRECRHKLGLSQAAFASELAIGVETCRVLDTGRRAVPDAILARARSLLPPESMAPSEAPASELPPLPITTNPDYRFRRSQRSWVSTSARSGMPLDRDDWWSARRSPSRLPRVGSTRICKSPTTSASAECESECGFASRRRVAPYFALLTVSLAH